MVGMAHLLHLAGPCSPLALIAYSIYLHPGGVEPRSLPAARRTVIGLEKKPARRLPVPRNTPCRKKPDRYIDPLFAHDIQHHSTVLELAFLRLVVPDGIGFTFPLRGDLLGCDGLAHEVFLHGLSSVLGELLVVLVAATGVRIPHHVEFGVRVLLREIDRLLQLREVRRPDGVFVRVEVDVKCYRFRRLGAATGAITGAAAGGGGGAATTGAFTVTVAVS